MPSSGYGTLGTYADANPVASPGSGPCGSGTAVARRRSYSRWMPVFRCHRARQTIPRTHGRLHVTNCTSCWRTRRWRVCHCWSSPRRTTCPKPRVFRRLSRPCAFSPLTQEIGYTHEPRSVLLQHQLLQHDEHWRDTKMAVHKTIACAHMYSRIEEGIRNWSRVQIGYEVRIDGLRMHGKRHLDVPG